MRDLPLPNPDPASFLCIVPLLHPSPLSLFVSSFSLYLSVSLSLAPLGLSPSFWPSLVPYMSFLVSCVRLSRVGALRSGSLREGPVALLCSVPPIWLAGRNPVVGATWVRLGMT